MVSPGTDHYSGSSSHPIGRLIEPEEIAELVAWLCSDQAAMVNGTLVAADTGWHVA